MALPNYEKAIKFSDTERGSIDTIYLTGGGYVDKPFRGIASNSQFGWEELTWFKTPTRNRTFAFQNMDDIDVGLIARCEFNIKYMDADDFVALRKIIGRERYFIATFFDMDTNKWVTRTMYCTENTRSQIFTLNQSLIGHINLTLKLVGTNTDQEERIVVRDDGTEEEVYVTKKYPITYNLNGGSSTDSDFDYSKVYEYYYASQVELAPSEDIIAPSGYHFKCWATKDKNGNWKSEYGSQQKITLWHGLDLYAEWEPYN